MVAKRKIDETGDSDDLQSLFDNIAAGGDEAAAPAAPAAPVVAAPAPPPVVAAVSAPPAAAPAAPRPANDGDDSDELQALFDNEVVKYASPEGADGDGEEDAGSGVLMFTRIGKMTRKLHDMLIELGLDSKLQEVANTIPDTRQRLNYVAQMTEQAASRVLNATDVAQPLAEQIESDADGLRGRWDKLFANQLTVEEFKALSKDSRAFLGTAVNNSQAINIQLREIMMAQDFQDLTGQVIKKVVEMAQSLESQLLAILVESAPEEVRAEKSSGLLNGPVINAEGRDDVVTSQEQADDLLASLGF